MKSYLYNKFKKVHDVLFGTTVRRTVVIVVSIIFIICLAVYSTYNYKRANSKEVMNYKLNNQDTNAAVDNSSENNKLLVAALKDEDISLYSIGYGMESDTGFAQFLLNVKGKSKTFNWINIKNPLYYPKLLYKDINNDNQKELIVLTTIYSGGELTQEVHVVNIADLSEMQPKVSIDSIVESSQDYKDQVDNSAIMKLMFPDKIFSEQNGVFTEKTTYHLEYKIESIEKGSFVQKNNEEYLVVVKQTGAPHACGLENRFVAVIDDTKTRLLSSVNEFQADNGQILTFKGKDISFIYFGGTLTYQGYTYSSEVTRIGLWKAGKEWQRLWQKDEDYWKDHVPMASKDMISIYVRKNFTNNPHETSLYAWELESILKWDSNRETFIEKDKNTK